MNNLIKMTAAGIAMNVRSSQAGVAIAADLKVFSTIGVQGAVEELVPQFEKGSGHKLAITWATAPMLVKRIQGGATADVMILNLAGIDIMSKEGRIAPGSGVTLASSGVAIAVKAGAPKPDISTPEALKKTLLNAKSISYTDPAAGGASGIYFAKLLERMGIANEINAKTKFPPPGGYSGTFLLTGEAELAVQQKPELMHIAGTEIVGPLPGDLNMVTVFAAGVWMDSKKGEAANALVKFLHSPEAAAVFKARGLDPL
jgi:molybdate transport system substrate-binding protein